MTCQAKALLSLTGSLCPSVVLRAVAENRGLDMFGKSKSAREFGHSYAVPMATDGKKRVVQRAEEMTRGVMRSGRPRRMFTATTIEVLRVLVWKFHNAATGKCFPSYDEIADKARCSRDTVIEAVKALKKAGILSVVSRITRIQEKIKDIFGRIVTITRIVTTSNGYIFHDDGIRPNLKNGRNPKGSEIPAGTIINSFFITSLLKTAKEVNPNDPLEIALKALGNNIFTRETKNAYE
jgi:Helix-turn-helix domain